MSVGQSVILQPEIQPARQLACFFLVRLFDCLFVCSFVRSFVCWLVATLLGKIRQYIIAARKQNKLDFSSLITKCITLSQIIHTTSNSYAFNSYLNHAIFKLPKISRNSLLDPVLMSYINLVYGYQVHVKRSMFITNDKVSRDIITCYRKHHTPGFPGTPNDIDF